MHLPGAGPQATIDALFVDLKAKREFYLLVYMDLLSASSRI